MTRPLAANLIFADDSLPGISRRRTGKGWRYFGPDQAPMTDRAEIARLNAIALPPAYRDGWFCPAANGHIQATGIDAKGRKQYRYHPLFRAAREAEKFDGCARFGQMLPHVRQRVEADLAAPGLTLERAVASVVRLLDTGSIRIGNEAYVKANKSFGATTLRMRHADLNGQTLKLRFKAKSGKLCEMEVTDRALARFVKKMQDLPGQNLFQYLDDDGAARVLTSSDVNAYLQQTTGGEFTAKNFRTWHASALAFELLALADQTLTLKAVLDEVSSRLSNTPAIARKSYIHPAVLAMIERQEKWRADLVLPRKSRWLSRTERGLINFIEGSEAAAPAARAS